MKNENCVSGHGDWARNQTAQLKLSRAAAASNRDAYIDPVHTENYQYQDDASVSLVTP